MTYDIIVCIKQVPHPDYLGKVTLDPRTGTISREGIPAVINPLDRNAIEEAVRIRERSGGRVTVMTMGPPQAKRALEEALAVEADVAVHLCDRAFAGADTLATAQALACGARKLGHFDLILCGNGTVDSGTGQVTLQLADFLALPCVTDVEEIAFESEQSIIVKRGWERGHIKVRVKLPAVLAVTEKINEPRLANVLAIIAATQKEITTWNAADIRADPARVGLCGSPTQVVATSEFHARRQGEVFRGPPEEAVNRAIDRLVKMEML